MEGDFTVGTWLVRPKLNSVSRNGKTAHLEPKVIQVLVYLAEHPDEVIPKERLIQAVWADTFVTDDVLTRAISELRRAFEDDPKDPRFIQTIPKGGYRLIAPVAPVFPPTSTRRVPLRLRWIVVAVTTVLTILAVLAALNLAGLRDRVFRLAVPPLGKIKLVVLPFDNLSGDPEQEYVSDGMTEEMTAQLARLQPERLAVIGRSSAMTYKHTGKTLDQIGEELRVQYVLEGSVRRAGARVRVTAQLIKVGEQTHVWAESYDRDLRDILALQGEVARAIADEVRIRLTPPQQARLEGARPVMPEAYEAYLKGRYHLGRFTAADTRKAREWFQRSVEKDPSYALAYSGLAETYSLPYGAWAGSVRETYARAREFSIKALEADDTLSEAHDSLARVKYEYDWDWPGAEAEFKRALELDPNNVIALAQYSELLSSLGQHEKAIAEASLGVEHDPVSPLMNSQLGYAFYLARQYDVAIEQFNKMLDLSADYSRTYLGLGRAYLEKGMRQESLEALEKADDCFERGLELLGYAYGATGQRAKALRIVDQLGTMWKQGDPDAAYALSRVFTGLGNKDRAMQFLEMAYKEHYPGMTLLKVDPEFDRLRADPPFQDLLRRMNFPE